VSGSHPLLPSTFHFSTLDDRPKPCVLKDVSSLTCSWVLHRVPITWCHPWRRLTWLQQPRVNSFSWSVYLGKVSLVFIRPQSAHKFRCDVAYRCCLPYAGRLKNTNPAQTPWSSCLFEQECFNRAKCRICDKRSNGLERAFCVVQGRNAACERWLLYGLA